MNYLAKGIKTYLPILGLLFAIIGFVIFINVVNPLITGTASGEDLLAILAQFIGSIALIFAGFYMMFSRMK